MCLHTQQYTADQTLTSEKHVYVKRFFAIVDRVQGYDFTFMYSARMHFPRPRDLTLLNRTSMTLRQASTSGEFGSFWMFIIQRSLEFSHEFIFKQMSPERREHVHCNQHKLVLADRQLPWCLSCCCWYIIVLQDVLHNQRESSIGGKH
jgi:hypothetical protein